MQAMRFYSLKFRYLLYSKFVGLYRIRSDHHIVSPTISDFLSESLTGEDYLKESLILDSYLSHSSAAFFTIFNSSYTPYYKRRFVYAWQLDLSHRADTS